MTARLNKLTAANQLFSLQVPLVIVIVYLVLAVLSAAPDDVTYDEATHLRYGVQVLKGNTSRSTNESGFRSTMPVSALNAIPRAAEQVLYPQTHKTDNGFADVKNGRYITILFSVLLLLYVFKFARLLGGDAAACVVMAFIAADPNILAHARLVTTDIFGTIAFVATLYHCYRWLYLKENLHFVFFSAAIALAQCCKPNNILLYPICFVPACIYLYKSRAVLTTARLCTGAGIFVACQLVIINAAFLFAGPFGQSLSQFQFRSQFFRGLQHGIFSGIPIPFVKSYVDAFDLIQYERETFDGTALNYLLGELRYKQGFWNYYIVCYLLKTPLLTILLAIAGFVYGLSHSYISRRFAAFCCWPAFFLLIFLSSSTIQNGYRYLLPFNCLLVIFASPLLGSLLSKTRQSAVFVILLLPFIVAITSFPDYLAYTNPVIYNKKMAYRYLADSNINWGQRTTAIAKFMQQHPGYVFEPAAPTVGKIVVDINKLAGIRQPEQFAWLRNNYVPVGIAEDCYLIFDVQKLP